MAIEIRNMSITSTVVQRQEDGGSAAGCGGEGCSGGGDNGAGREMPPPDDWRAECRRLIAELLELRRER